MHIKVNIDGSCEPINPGGKMGIGIFMIIDGQEQIEHSETVPANKLNSCNVAEYMALEWLLSFVELNGIKNSTIVVKSDSQLLVNQMGGTWKVKYGLYRDKALLCRDQVITLTQENGIDFKFQWIPREQNEYADSLSKR